MMRTLNKWPRDPQSRTLPQQKAVAYKPGQDFTWVFDQNCRQPASRATDASAAAPQAPAAATPRIPPRSEWFQEPSKVFDNLYYVGSQLQSIWLVKTSDGLNSSRYGV